MLVLRWPSRWPSRSRCRCSRSTPGCPTPTSRRRRAGSVILAGVLLKMGTYGFMRFAVPLFPGGGALPWAPTLARARGDRHHLRRAGGDGAAGHEEAGGLLLGGPPGLRDAGHLRPQRAGRAGRDPGDDRPRLSTGALFFLVGMLYERRHTRRSPTSAASRRWCRCSRRCSPWWRWRRSGCPGMSGFVGEFLVLLGSFRPHPVATGMATTGVIFAAAYLLWMCSGSSSTRWTSRRTRPSRPDGARAGRAAAAGGGHRLDGALSRTGARADRAGGARRYIETVRGPMASLELSEQVPRARR